MSFNPFFERRQRGAREAALFRPELREASAARKDAAGVTSFPVKVMDAAAATALADWMAFQDRAEREMAELCGVDDMVTLQMAKARK